MGCFLAIAKKENSQSATISLIFDDSAATFAMSQKFPNITTSYAVKVSSSELKSI